MIQEWIHGDGMDTLRKLEANSVDLILTDPPYLIGKKEHAKITFSDRKAFNLDIAEWDKVDFNPEDWIDEFVRVLAHKGNIMIFCADEQLSPWKALIKERMDRSNYFVWVKSNPMPRARRSGLLQGTELMAIGYNKGHTWNFKGQNEMRNWLQTPICMGKERIKNASGDTAHPTQKPEQVIRHLMEIGSCENDLVLDPFGGLATTAAVAKMIGRQFISCELDADYYALGKQRLAGKTREMTLYG